MSGHAEEQHHAQLIVSIGSFISAGHTTLFEGHFDRLDVGANLTLFRLKREQDLAMRQVFTFHYDGTVICREEIELG
jgi:hypothetical protein